MRLIDADAIYDKIEERYRNSSGLEHRCERDFLDFICDAPTVDAVEVVRCRYCKHFTGGKAIGMCNRNPDKPIIPVFYNHFCSYGERRKNDEAD